MFLPPKIFLPPTFFSPPPYYFCCAPSLTPIFKSLQKVGGVNTQNTPGFGTPVGMGMGYAWFRVWLRAWVMHGLG